MNEWQEKKPRPPPRTTPCFVRRKHIYWWGGGWGWSCAPRNMIKLALYQKSIIIGLLLSDGWLIIASKTHKNARLGFKQSLDRSTYVWFVFNLLSHYCSNYPQLTKGVRLGKPFYLNFFNMKSIKQIALHNFVSRRVTAIQSLQYVVSPHLRLEVKRLYSNKSFSVACSAGLELKLNAWFVTGLIDGEGCFMLFVEKNTKLRSGWEVKLGFVINLHDKDLPLLQAIQAYFGGIGRFAKHGKTTTRRVVYCNLKKTINGNFGSFWQIPFNYSEKRWLPFI